MTLLNQLQNNKGTVSSALGKQLAIKVLEGDKVLLKKAVEYTSYDPNNKKSKSVRAGAAKIIEKVAEKKPELIAPYLDQLLPALAMPEPQTRWMIINTFGLCATHNPKAAKKGMTYAENYVQEQNGVCLTSAANKYLGHVGELSKQDAQKVLPKLLKSLQTASTNEVDWILESFLCIADNLTPDDQETILNYAKNYIDAPKKSTIKRVEKIIKKITAPNKS